MKTSSHNLLKMSKGNKFRHLKQPAHSCGSVSIEFTRLEVISGHRRMHSVDWSTMAESNEQNHVLPREEGIDANASLFAVAYYIGHHTPINRHVRTAAVHITTRCDILVSVRACVRRSAKNPWPPCTIRMQQNAPINSFNYVEMTILC